MGSRRGDMMRRRDLLQGPGLLAGALALAPALPRQAVGAASADRTDLVVAVGSDITLLDPHFATSASDLGFVFNLYDTLLRRDRSQHILPSLAIEWQLVAATTWDFKLRR